MMVTIMRGIAGSGKSSYIEKNLHKFDNARIVSADAHFYVEGVYRFNPAEISVAHTRCFADYLEIFKQYAAGSEEFDQVFVDNTNITAAEMSPYVAVAKVYEVEYRIMTVWCEPDVAFKRCIHSVPASAILQQYMGLLQEQLPTFWQRSMVYF